MRLVSGIQYDGVEVCTTWLVADILVYRILSQLVQANGVGEGLAARLQGELGVDGAKGESVRRIHKWKLRTLCKFDHSFFKDLLFHSVDAFLVMLLENDKIIVAY